MACEKALDCRERTTLNTSPPLHGLAGAWAGKRACKPAGIDARRISCALKT